MFLKFLNFNRYKITKTAFSVFLIVGILNWALMPSFVTYAEDEPLTNHSTETISTETVVVEEPALEPDLPSETVVDTGEAVSQTEIQSDVNTNEIVSQPDESDESNSSFDLNIVDENEAEVVNTAITSAQTGENTASSSGETIIVTGDAISNTDVVNTVNTNIIESEGEIVAGGGSLGGSSLDLRDNFVSTSGSSCTSCVGDISIENQNTATVTNNIIVKAETGNNNASSTATTTIITGDAYAGANIINIVNTNIIKSNYMILAFNNFGDWSGDLIFPNGDFFNNFFSSFASNCVTCGGDIKVLNDNEVNISNSINTSANTGENNASGDGSSINSGNSLASSNVYNELNTNIYGGSSFYLMVRVFGDWNGNIFNLPDNIAWQKIGEEIILYDKNDGNPFDNQENNILGNKDLSIQNTNDADILNNIEVSANTGGNNASGQNSLIQTGNAYASSNQINIVNTNVISSNWTAALINIFGNWQGNISFGQPDLWIGTIAETAGPLTPGAPIKYTTTIKNNGDATASGIQILAESQSKYLDIGNENEWFVSPLSAGEETEISYYGKVVGDPPNGDNDIINKTSVFLTETDANLNDNTDFIKLSLYKNPTIILPYNSRTTSYSDLEVTKTHSLPSSVVVDGVEMVPFGATIDYKIVIKNHGGKAYEGILIDQLKDESGEIINEQTWNLEEIFPDEEITITYTTELTEETIPGIYTNYAWVEALSGDYTYDRNLASVADSNVASDKIIVAKKLIMPKIEEVQQEIVEEILGAFTENVSIINKEDKPTDSLLGTFCSEDQNKKVNTLTFTQSLLLGLSFVLVIKKRKDIPINLFLF